MQGPGGFPGGYGIPGGAGSRRGRRRWAGGAGGFGSRGQQSVLGLAMVLAQQAMQLEQKPPVTILLVAGGCWGVA